MQKRLSVKVRVLALFLTITLHLIAFDLAYAQPIPIGMTAQVNPYESNPTAETYSHVGTPTPPSRIHA